VIRRSRAAQCSRGRDNAKSGERDETGRRRKETCNGNRFQQGVQHGCKDALHHAAVPHAVFRFLPLILIVLVLWLEPAESLVFFTSHSRDLVGRQYDSRFFSRVWPATYAFFLRLAFDLVVLVQLLVLAHLFCFAAAVLGIFHLSNQNGRGLSFVAHLLLAALCQLRLRHPHYCFHRCALNLLFIGQKLLISKSIVTIVLLFSSAGICCDFKHARGSPNASNPCSHDSSIRIPRRRRFSCCLLNFSLGIQRWHGCSFDASTLTFCRTRFLRWGCQIFIPIPLRF